MVFGKIVIFVARGLPLGSLGTTTSPAMTTPTISNIIGQNRKNNRAARARAFLYISLPFSSKQQLEMTILQ